MIIDFHCHAGRGDGMTGPPFTDAPLGAYLRRARAAGIGRTVILPCFHSDYGRANAELAKIVAADPRHLIGFAFVHSRRDAGRIGEMVARAVRSYGFRAAADRRPPHPLSQRLHRHLGRPPLRLPGRGRPPRRSRQAPLRDRRPLAPSGPGAGEDPSPAAAGGSGGADPGRKCAAVAAAPRERWPQENALAPRSASASPSNGFRTSGQECVAPGMRRRWPG